MLSMTLLWTRVCRILTWLWFPETSGLTNSGELWPSDVRYPVCAPLPWKPWSWTLPNEAEVASAIPYWLYEQFVVSA